MRHESDRRFKLRRAASEATVLGAGEVKIPTHREYTLQKVPSSPDLNSNRAYIYERYSPKVSHYHYYHDSHLMDDYWNDRRCHYAPVSWPYQFFAGRRYNLLDAPYSTYWSFSGLNYYPGYLRDAHIDTLPSFGTSATTREPAYSKPWWSYSVYKRPWSNRFSDASRATALYRKNIIDFETLQHHYMGPSYEQRRTEEMKRLYHPLLYPRYIMSY